MTLFSWKSKYLHWYIKTFCMCLLLYRKLCTCVRVGKSFWMKIQICSVSLVDDLLPLKVSQLDDTRKPMIAHVASWYRPVERMRQWVGGPLARPLLGFNLETGRWPGADLTLNRNFCYRCSCSCKLKSRWQDLGLIVTDLLSPSAKTVVYKPESGA